MSRRPTKQGRCDNCGRWNVALIEGVGSCCLDQDDAMRFEIIDQDFLEEWNRVCVCIRCGCDDEHACATAEGPCSWTVVDPAQGLGICSGCTPYIVTDKAIARARALGIPTKRLS